MKKVKIFIPYKTILMSALFYSNTINANGPSIPPPPPGFEQTYASDTDIFMIPMVIIGIICTIFLGIAIEFLFIRKNNRAY